MSVSLQPGDLMLTAIKRNAKQAAGLLRSGNSIACPWSPQHEADHAAAWMACLSQELANDATQKIAALARSTGVAEDLSALAVHSSSSGELLNRVARALNSMEAI